MINLEIKRCETVEYVIHGSGFTSKAIAETFKSDLEYVCEFIEDITYIRDDDRMKEQVVRALIFQAENLAPVLKRIGSNK